MTKKNLIQQKNYFLNSFKPYLEEIANNIINK